MPTPLNERSSTYMVQDRSNSEELTRLAIQDQVLTTSMGGALSEQSDLTRLQRVLDVGCGTGGWLIEAARSIPTISLLIGVDISKMMVEYARAQAVANQVSDRVEYHVMDVLQMLEFPAAFFDLVNQRLGISYLRVWDWHKLLKEYQRVTRPGGVIRITEGAGPVCNSPVLTRLHDLFFQALSHAGHMPSPDDKDGLVNGLVPLLERYGFKDVQKHSYLCEARAGTPEGQHFIEDEARLFRTLLPFFRKWCHVPDDYEDIYQRALDEMQRPDFVATWELCTVWGTNPSQKK